MAVAKKDQERAFPFAKKPRALSRSVVSGPQSLIMSQRTGTFAPKAFSCLKALRSRRYYSVTVSPWRWTTLHWPSSR